MKAIEQIVVPVDFTVITEKLVLYAQYMTEKLTAVVHFVHVVADYPGDAMIGSPFAKEYKDKVVAASEEKMRKPCPTFQEDLSRMYRAGCLW